MIICYHLACVKNYNGPHKLRHIFRLNEFLLHLEDHVDEIGIAIHKPSAAIEQNPFLTKEELYDLAPAASELISNPDYGGLETHIESHGIQHILHHFLYHWKTII